MARLALIWLALSLLVGCKGVEYGLVGVIVSLTSLHHGHERPQYPNASTYGEIDGVHVPEAVAASDLLGSYSLPVGPHGVAIVRFTTDSTLTYRAFDGFAQYDVEVEGRWKVAGNVVTIELPPLEVDPGFTISQGHSGVLDVVAIEGGFLLVPLDRKEGFLRFGLAWLVFRRVHTGI